MCTNVQFQWNAKFSDTLITVFACRQSISGHGGFSVLGQIDKSLKNTLKIQQNTLMHQATNGGRVCQAVVYFVSVKFCKPHLSPYCPCVCYLFVLKIGLTTFVLIIGNEVINNQSSKNTTKSVPTLTQSALTVTPFPRCFSDGLILVT